MSKVLKTEQKTTSDDSLHSSTFKSSSNLNSDTYKKVFIVSSLNKKRFKTNRKDSRISNRKNIHGYWDKNEHNKFIEAYI